MNKTYWNLIGLFYNRIVNRMRCGTNKYINNWQTLTPKVSFKEYNDIESPTMSTIKAHTFWHGEIGEKQLFSLKSFLCTQNLYYLDLCLWLDGDDSYDKALRNKELMDLVSSSNHKISIKKWNVEDEIIGTPFERIKWYFKWDRILPFVADDFRIVCLYKYGGLYFDLDIMFVKDLIPLLMRGEFVYAWENQPFANNALLYFRKESYLINIIAKEMIKHKSSQPWILFKYKNLKLASLIVYPCSMFDPLWVGYKPGMPINKFEDFFKPFDESFKKDENISSYKDFFKGIYAYHWHNHWHIQTNKESYYGIFNKEFSDILENENFRNSSHL